MPTNRLVSKVLRKTGLNVLLNHIYDFYRFYASRTPGNNVAQMDQDAASMHLLRLMHSLEKGMALPAPSPGFGKKKALNLHRQALAYRRRFGDDHIYRLCLATLAAHQRFQLLIEGDHAGFPLEDFDREVAGTQAGARRVTREEFLRTARIDFGNFALNRSSVRNFTGEPIDEADILDAIRVASKSPSVCNRACAKAYYSNDPDVIARALSHQSGNAGFGHLAGAVFIITADMRAFYKSGERNQAWIDGGLFAMSLNYALHSKGYGACMLNWSMDAANDVALRREFRIPREHSVVMMMVARHVPETFAVTISPHRDISNFAIRMA